MDLKLYQLIDKLKGHKTIAIYGMGRYSEEVLNRIYSFDTKVDYVIVTHNSTGTKRFMDIPVFEINDIAREIIKKNALVVIAVSEIYEKEIVQILKERQITNYCLLTDYIRKAGDLLDVSDDKFEKNICQYMKEKEYGTLDLYLHSGINPRKIVFGIGLMSPRVIKMGRALRKKGYEIIGVFCPDVYIDENYMEEINRVCNITYRCSSVEEFVYRVLKEAPFIIHMFTCLDFGLDTTYILLQHKKYFGKIVFDEYDVFTGMDIGNHCNIAKEKFCFEESDGICERGYWTNYLKGIGVEIKGKNIIFFDYVDEYVEAKKENAETLSIYYAGGLVAEELHPNNPLACLNELIRLCERNKCHFHLYPNSWHEDLYGEYIKLGAEMECFHIHRPIPFKELIEEVSNYDFGIVYAKDGSRESIRKDMTLNSTNKIFDALAAGVPVIAPVPIKFISIFREKGILLDWTIGEYDFDYLRKNKKRMKQKVAKVRGEYFIDKKIDDLISFYYAINCVE